MRFQSSKTYGHEVGLSCCFRQWRAESHCRFLHGYALSARFDFEAEVLDERNWVVDFGSLKGLKAQVQELLDHKTLVAADDPELDAFRDMDRRGLLQLRVVKATGCEGVAAHLAELAQQWLVDQRLAGRVRLACVEVREHGANGAKVML